MLAHKVLLPGATTLERFVAKLRHRVDVRVWRVLASGISPPQQRRLEDLLRVPDEGRSSSLVQLNRGEGRHALARAVFHGKRGELRQRYREGQENQLDALGVVVNMIVLWNTIYMQAALDQHRADGHSVRPEDEARLSPLGHEHINLLGRYSFAVPESVARGELRPLRNPADGGR